MTESEEYLQRVVEQLPAEKLGKIAQRVAWKIRIFITLFVVSLLAGIWVDWRWFPTSIIPLVFMLYYSYFSKALREDAVRRINEFKAAQDG